jgi:hypothetical protein
VILQQWRPHLFAPSSSHCFFLPFSCWIALSNVIVSTSFMTLFCFVKLPYMGLVLLCIYYLGTSFHSEVTDDNISPWGWISSTISHLGLGSFFNVLSWIFCSVLNPVQMRSDLFFFFFFSFLQMGVCNCLLCLMFCKIFDLHAWISLCNSRTCLLEIYTRLCWGSKEI